MTFADTPVLDNTVLDNTVVPLEPLSAGHAEDLRAVGMATFMNLDEPNLHVEVGSTWLGREAQGAGINPAIELIPLSRAKQDGVLRNHQVWHDGTLRDTVVFSIIAGGWPAVRSGLLARLEKNR